MPGKSQQIIICTFLSCMLLLSSCVSNIKLPDTFTGGSAVAEWLQSLNGKTSAEQSAMAAHVWADASQSNELRNRATYILASRYSPQSKIALSSLANQYKVSATTQKINMEETLYTDLNGTRNDDIRQILSLITPSLETQFPYSLVIYVAAKRNLLSNSQNIVATLSSHKFFQSPKVIGISPQIQSSVSGNVALLLPQSGNIEPITQQIIAGAEAARLYLQSMGISWTIHYIDTQNPQWIQQIRALPADCVTIGGPLQYNDYDTLKVNNILQERAVFSFLQRLPIPADEGQLSWQFFTKQEDQINAMLNISSQQLGINSFGVFAPVSPYGTSMTALFTQIAISKGFSVQSAHYPLDDIKAWTDISRVFLDSKIIEDEDLPKVNAPFDAIFFPDAWRNMDHLISTMHYHGAHEKIMLGNAYWEQSLNQPQTITPMTFALTVFPVAYDPTQEKALSKQFKDSLTQKGMTPNDWSVLGFDFMLMASQLNLTEKLNASDINTRLAALQVSYVGAPFYWTSQGISQRALFINQPARSGRVPFDLEKFVEYRKKGGAIPNQTKSVLTEKQLKNQEKQALDKMDALINSILLPTNN